MSFDEIRFSDTIRWTNSFTPPTQEYSPPPTAATPSISPATGTYPKGSLNITLTTNESGGSTYYTIDESTPTSGSTLYTAPFALNASATVKAITAKTDYNNSAVASTAYTVLQTTNSFKIGSKDEVTGSNMYMDELRIQVGSNPYPTDFTPPIHPFA
jgi:hypothetical protein